MDWLKELGNYELIGTLVIGVLVVLLGAFREWVYDTVRELFGRLFPRDHAMNATCIAVDRSISELLVELRTLLKADRARVFQFHNGSVFSVTNNSMWKVTCTHETCRQGISHEINQSRDLLSSWMWEFLEPFYDRSKLPRGVTLIDDGDPTTADLFWIDVTQLAEGYFKSLLIAQGISNLAVAPLVYRRQPFGFVTASWCGARAGMAAGASNASMAQVPPSIEAVRKCAFNIVYQLKRAQ